MIDRIRRQAASLAIVVLIAAVLTGGPATHAGVWLGDLRQTLTFAAEMAERGNWREARYRWEQALREHPDDPRLLNNLGVALEALGETDEALESYRRALTLSGGHSAIEGNLSRARFFWETVATRGEGSANEDAAEGEADTDAIDPYAAASQMEPANGKPDKKKTKGKTTRVTVGLPVPPRLALEGDETILVTSFLSHETNLLNSNRELVRFLRSEFRKHTGHPVPDINPPPAIPEQTVEDLVANAEFWKHLGRNYDADLIVSGLIVYDRQDVSTFQDVDLISSRTGQKVRRNRFVEQEEFQYALDIFFMDGATGELRFRDRMKRSVIFQGLQNDPIAAFHALSESIAGDVLAVITGRIRADNRVIFKR